MSLDQQRMLMALEAAERRRDATVMVGVRELRKLVDELAAHKESLSRLEMVNVLAVRSEEDQ